MENKMMFTAKDIQNYIGCTYKMALRLMCCSQMKSIKIGKKYYVSVANFEQFLKINQGKEVLI